MAVETDILNCGTGNVGTWFDGCEVTAMDFEKIFLKSPSATIDLATDTFDEATIATLIKNGQLVALNDILTIADVPAKNNYQTLPNKKEIFISQGLYKFNVDFKANVCLIKALHKLVKKNWELLLLDTDSPGKLFFDNKGGKLNGFEIQDISIDNETVNDGGGKTSMVSMSIQLTKNGTKGYNERRSYVLSTDDMDFYSVHGVQDVKISADTLSVASLKVRVLSGCDGSTPVLGLATANFRVLNATTGANIPVTAVENGSGQYTLSGATAGARTIQLYDITNGTAITDIMSKQFYQSNVLAATLTS